MTEAWLTEGNARLGARVRRAIISDVDSEKVVGYADGTVVGWLPSHLSDFISDFTHKPAPLWHIKYDSRDMGEEDLEEVEVDDAHEAFAQNAWSTAKDTHDSSEYIQKIILSLGGNTASAKGVGNKSTSWRQAFNEEQKQILEAHFETEHFISKETAKQLATRVDTLNGGRHVDENCVFIWFMNRRKRVRKSSGNCLAPVARNTSS